MPELQTPFFGRPAFVTLRRGRRLRATITVDDNGQRFNVIDPRKLAKPKLAAPAPQTDPPVRSGRVADVSGVVGCQLLGVSGLFVIETQEAFIQQSCMNRLLADN
jgi:hypothetical protein